jgi:hypothetical protein
LSTSKPRYSINFPLFDDDKLVNHNEFLKHIIHLPTIAEYTISLEARSPSDCTTLVSISVLACFNPALLHRPIIGCSIPILTASHAHLLVFLFVSPSTYTLEHFIKYYVSLSHIKTEGIINFPLFDDDKPTHNTKDDLHFYSHVPP